MSNFIQKIISKATRKFQYTPVATEVEDTDRYELSNYFSIQFDVTIRHIEDDFLIDYDIANIRLPETIISIGRSFCAMCPRLKSFQTPSNLEIIGDNFLLSCDSLEKLYLNNGLKIIGNSFLAGCNKLSFISIPPSVEFIGNNFVERCIALKCVILPLMLKRMGDKPFNACDKLEQIFYHGPTQLALIPVNIRSQVECIDIIDATRRTSDDDED